MTTTVDDEPILTGPWRPNGEKLLRAAIEVIEEGGVEALRVEHLVKQVGLTIPEVYRQFRNRQGLVNAVQAERYVRSQVADLARLEAVVDESTSADDFRMRLNALMLEVLEPARVSNAWRRVNVLGSAYANEAMLEAIRAIARDTEARMLDVLARADRRGWLRSGADVAGALAWFNATVFGRVLARLDRRSPLQSDRWRQATLDVVNRELFDEPAPPISEIAARR